MNDINYCSINNRNTAFKNITRLLYNAIYSEIYEDLPLKMEVEENIGKMLRSSIMMERPFFQGRLWLCWVINYLVTMEIVEKDNTVVQRMLSLYSRPDMIWDACPDYIPENCNVLNDEALILSNLMSLEETHARYVVQEWAINHINRLERLFFTNKSMVSNYTPSPTFLISSIIFLRKADVYKIYPTKVPNLMEFIELHLNNITAYTDKILYSAINGENFCIDRENLDNIELNKLYFFGFIFRLNLPIVISNVPYYDDIPEGKNQEQYLFIADKILKHKKLTRHE